MSQESKEVTWEVQRKLNTWDEKRRATGALEELMEGKIRYLKFIHNKLGSEAVNEVLGIFVKDQFEKNMGGLTKLGANFLKKISKSILLKKILTGFYINMQHMVNIRCIKKLEIHPESIEVIVQKCTAKRAWKRGLKSNKVRDIFTDQKYCEQMCVPLFKKLLGVANADTTVDYEKRGCHHIIEFKK